jgi:ribosomal protein S18 acetylase RimI-like enzyme
MKSFFNTIVRFALSFKRPSRTANARLIHERGENVESMIIRVATPTEISKIAALHVKTWNDTYWYVKYKPTYELRERQWKEKFKVTDDSWFCFLVENKKREFIGFAKGKVYNHSDLPDFSGELNKIYLLREYQRLGLGRKLVGHIARRFIDKGIHTMVLFAEPQNPSCQFFEKLGGHRLYAKNGEFHGGYGWRDIRRLAETRE